MARIVETVDAAEDASTVYAMGVGDEFIGTTRGANADLVAVQLTKGTTYNFGMVGLGAMNSGLTDPFLRLLDANLTQVKSNDDGGPGATASLTYTAEATGTYYISAAVLAGAHGGDYGLSMTLGTKSDYSAELGAAELYRPGASWAEAPETGVVISWGVRDSGPAWDASGERAPFSQLSAAQIEAAHLALANYSDVCGVVFEQVNPDGTTDDATILMGAYTSDGDGSGAYAYYPGDPAADSEDGDLWINNDAVSKSELPIGTYDYFVFLHELGHSLGLDHPGDYNAAPGVDITYENDAQFLQDSNQFTVMSYFNATDTQPNAPSSYCDTLMMYDILAVQKLYGVNLETRAGNTVYGFNTTEAGGAYDFTVNTDPLMCIWDGAGVDTLDLSGFDMRQRINLTDGSFSDVAGYIGNLSIAVGAMIENAIGGSFRDRIQGNALDNSLAGGFGADTLNGGAGDDTLLGGAQNDELSGGLGNDVLKAGGGQDLMDGGRGNDTLLGQAGADGFVFGGAFGKDRVMDFGLGNDVIFLSKSIWGGGLTVAQMLSEYAQDLGSDILLDFGVREIFIKGVGDISDLRPNIELF